jgi:hypothetical protein
MMIAWLIGSPVLLLGDLVRAFGPQLTGAIVRAMGADLTGEQASEQEHTLMMTGNSWHSLTHSCRNNPACMQSLVKQTHRIHPGSGDALLATKSCDTLFLVCDEQ